MMGMGWLVSSDKWKAPYEIMVEMSENNRGLVGLYSSSTWWSVVPNFCSRATRKS